MARTLHVYPKATIVDSEWTLVVKVHDPATRATSRFAHVVPAGVTVEVPLRLLKVSFDLIVDDADTDQDVDDALFVDDIKPGAQTETVWSNWQELAETKIVGLGVGYVLADFWAAWGPSDTSAVRSDARRALVTQRGWTIPAGSVHQHEGDGTVSEE